MSRRLIYLLLSALLAGCSTRVDYVRPAAPIPAAWPASGSAGGLGQEAPPAKVGWRDFFSDPRLQKLISLAIENNRDLRIATARVEEARATYGIVSAERLPTINAGASMSKSLTSETLASSSSQDTRRKDVSLTLASFELDFWGRLASMSEAARADYLATEEGQRLSRLSLVSEVANAYFALLEADERLRVTRATVASWEQTVEVTMSGREYGAASKLDVLQVEAALAGIRGDLASMERQRSNALNALDLLIGFAPPPIADGNPLRLQRMDVIIAAGIPAATLMQRPDIIAAEQRLIAAHANIAAARAAFFPRILLTAGLGLASPALATLFSAAGKNWNFQPSMSLPIFDGGRTAGNLDIAVARRTIAVAEYEKTIQQAFREVADLLVARKTYADQRAAAEALAAAREERVQAVRARYRAGASTLLDVLEATRGFHEAQQTLVQVQRAQFSSAAQLFKALGGDVSG